MTDEQIDQIFTYHPPKGPGQTEKYQDLREAGRRFAHVLNIMCPESREKSLAITHLQEVVMWANASIAIHE